MRLDSYRAGLGLAMLGVMLAVAASGACGGNVVVDPTPKSTSGTGGATVTSSSSGMILTDATSSTGTGPSCGCAQFCANVPPCVPIGACMTACASSPPSVLTCVCNAGTDCASVQSCFGAMSGVASSSSSGNAMACSQCANQAATSQCSNQLDACAQVTECHAIQNCHDQCGFGPGCAQQCDYQHPMGEPFYQVLMNCAVCSNCAAECAGLPVFMQYCGMGG